MTYNQSDKAGQVRVGNWYEELRLKEETGIRFYPSPKDRSTSLMTNSRCIAHTETLDPKEYKSVTKETIINPVTHPEYKWQKILQNGPRRQAVEQQLRARVAQEFETKKKQESRDSLIVDYTSETKSRFSIRGFTPHIDEVNVSSRIPTNPPKFVTETAISFYSDSIRRGDAISFPTTAVVTANPFRRNGAFSTDVYKDTLSKRSESNERPMPLPTVRDHRVLSNLRIRLIKHVKASNEGEPGKAVRDVIRALWADAQENSTGIVHVSRLGMIFDHYFAFQLSGDEEYSLLSAFDAGYTDHLLLVEFSNFIRRVGNAKRLELIGTAFGLICDQDGAFTDESTIRERCLNDDIDGIIRDLNDVHNYSRALTTASASSTPKRTARRSPRANSNRQADFSVDDFFDYYIDVSAEIEEDADFENLIRSSWGF